MKVEDFRVENQTGGTRSCASLPVSEDCDHPKSEPSAAVAKHEAALAYLNSLRSVFHDTISKPICDIDWRLDRIADEYSNTDVADGIAIARDVNEIMQALRDIKRNVEKLEDAVKEVRNER